MHSLRFSILIAVLALASSSTPALADDCTPGSPAAYFDLSLQADGYFPGPCDIAMTGASARIYVRAIAIPFQKARVTLPDIPGVTVVNESWGSSFTGNHATGVELDMGSCVGPFDRPAPVLIGYVDVVWGSPANCTSWRLTGTYILDCGGVWRPVTPTDKRVGPIPCGLCAWQWCYGPLAPYDPQPPNGATGVPLDVVLKWKFTFGEAYWPVSYIRISSNANCAGGGTYFLQKDFQFAPNFLEPGRTYYWQAHYGDTYDGGCQDTGGVAVGPIYSFTTEGVLAVLPTTWGHVKSFYRE